MEVKMNDQPTPTVTEDIKRVWLFIKIDDGPGAEVVAEHIFSQANKFFACESYRTAIVRADVVDHSHYNLVVPFFTDEAPEALEVTDLNKPLKPVSIKTVIEKIEEIIRNSGVESFEIDTAEVVKHTPLKTTYGEGYVTKAEVNSPGRGRTPEGHNPW
jgi:hypothetical protein